MKINCNRQQKSKLKWKTLNTKFIMKTESIIHECAQIMMMVYSNMMAIHLWKHRIKRFRYTLSIFKCFECLVSTKANWKIPEMPVRIVLIFSLCSPLVKIMMISDIFPYSIILVYASSNVWINFIAWKMSSSANHTRIPTRYGLWHVCVLLFVIDSFEWIKISDWKVQWHRLLSSLKSK